VTTADSWAVTWPAKGGAAWVQYHVELDGCADLKSIRKDRDKEDTMDFHSKAWRWQTRAVTWPANFNGTAVLSWMVGQYVPCTGKTVNSQKIEHFGYNISAKWQL
jgi:hypothetical protein